MRSSCSKIDKKFGESQSTRSPRASIPSKAFLNSLRLSLGKLIGYFCRGCFLAPSPINPSNRPPIRIRSEVRSEPAKSRTTIPTTPKKMQAAIVMARWIILDSVGNRPKGGRDSRRSTEAPLRACPKLAKPRPGVDAEHGKVFGGSRKLAVFGGVPDRADVEMYWAGKLV
jgi:hypothetical protein